MADISEYDRYALGHGETPGENKYARWIPLESIGAIGNPGCGLHSMYAGWPDWSMWQDLYFNAELLYASSCAYPLSAGLDASDDPFEYPVKYPADLKDGDLPPDEGFWSEIAEHDQSAAGQEYDCYYRENQNVVSHDIIMSVEIDDYQKYINHMLALRQQYADSCSKGCDNSLNPVNDIQLVWVDENTVKMADVKQTSNQGDDPQTFKEFAFSPISSQEIKLNYVSDDEWKETEDNKTCGPALDGPWQMIEIPLDGKPDQTYSLHPNRLSQPFHPMKAKFKFDAEGYNAAGCNEQYETAAAKVLPSFPAHGGAAAPKTSQSAEIEILFETSVTINSPGTLTLSEEHTPSRIEQRNPEDGDAEDFNDFPDYVSPIDMLKQMDTKSYSWGRQDVIVPVEFGYFRLNQYNMIDNIQVNIVKQATHLEGWCQHSYCKDEDLVEEKRSTTTQFQHKYKCEKTSYEFEGFPSKPSASVSSGTTISPKLEVNINEDDDRTTDSITYDADIFNNMTYDEAYFNPSFGIDCEFRSEWFDSDVYEEGNRFDDGSKNGPGTGTKYWYLGGHSNDGGDVWDWPDCGRSTCLWPPHQYAFSIDQMPPQSTQTEINPVYSVDIRPGGRIACPGTDTVDLREVPRLSQLDGKDATVDNNNIRKVESRYDKRGKETRTQKSWVDSSDVCRTGSTTKKQSTFNFSITPPQFDDPKTVHLCDLNPRYAGDFEESEKVLDEPPFGWPRSNTDSYNEYDRFSGDGSSVGYVYIPQQTSDSLPGQYENGLAYSMLGHHGHNFSMKYVDSNCEEQVVAASETWGKCEESFHGPKECWSTGPWPASPGCHEKFGSLVTWPKGVPTGGAQAQYAFTGDAGETFPSQNPCADDGCSELIPVKYVDRGLEMSNWVTRGDGVFTTSTDLIDVPELEDDEFDHTRHISWVSPGKDPDKVRLGTISGQNFPLDGTVDFNRCTDNVGSIWKCGTSRWWEAEEKCAPGSIYSIPVPCFCGGNHSPWTKCGEDGGTYNGECYRWDCQPKPCTTGCCQYERRECTRPSYWHQTEMGEHGRDFPCWYPSVAGDNCYYNRAPEQTMQLAKLRNDGGWVNGFSGNRRRHVIKPQGLIHDVFGGGGAEWGDAPHCTYYAYSNDVNGTGVIKGYNQKHYITSRSRGGETIEQSIKKGLDLFPPGWGGCCDGETEIDKDDILPGAYDSISGADKYKKWGETATLKVISDSMTTDELKSAAQNECGGATRWDSSVVGVDKVLSKTDMILTRAEGHLFGTTRYTGERMISTAIDYQNTLHRGYFEVSIISNLTETEEKCIERFRDMSANDSKTDNEIKEMCTEDKRFGAGGYGLENGYRREWIPMRVAMRVVPKRPRDVPPTPEPPPTPISPTPEPPTPTPEPPTPTPPPGPTPTPIGPSPPPPPPPTWVPPAVGPTPYVPPVPGPVAPPTPTPAPPTPAPPTPAPPTPAPPTPTPSYNFTPTVSIDSIDQLGRYQQDEVVAIKVKGWDWWGNAPNTTPTPVEKYISFEGSSSDYEDGANSTIFSYEWYTDDMFKDVYGNTVTPNADGLTLISTQRSFMIDPAQFVQGVHNISFRGQDSGGKWSNVKEKRLHVRNRSPEKPTASGDVMDLESGDKLLWMQGLAVDISGNPIYTLLLSPAASLDYGGQGVNSNFDIQEYEMISSLDGVVSSIYSYGEAAGVLQGGLSAFMIVWDAHLSVIPFGELTGYGFHQHEFSVGTHEISVRAKDTGTLYDSGQFGAKYGREGLWSEPFSLGSLTKEAPPAPPPPPPTPVGPSIDFQYHTNDFEEDLVLNGELYYSDDYDNMSDYEKSFYGNEREVFLQAANTWSSYLAYHINTAPDYAGANKHTFNTYFEMVDGGEDSGWTMRAWCAGRDGRTGLCDECEIAYNSRFKIWSTKSYQYRFIVMQHELGHCLGVSSQTWGYNNPGILSGWSYPNTKEWHAIQTTQGKSKGFPHIPVTSHGGYNAGTNSNGHWISYPREYFGQMYYGTHNDIMSTGVSSSTSRQITRQTTEFLGELGWSNKDNPDHLPTIVIPKYESVPDGACGYPEDGNFTQTVCPDGFTSGGLWTYGRYRKDANGNFDSSLGYTSTSKAYVRRCNPTGGGLSTQEEEEHQEVEDFDFICGCDTIDKFKNEISED